jgi:hypothetical protein
MNVFKFIQSTFWNSAEKLWKQKLLWLLSIVSDLGFFYFLTMLHVESFTKISLQVAKVTSIVEQKAGELTTTELGNLGSYLSQTQSFTTHYYAILQELVLFMLGVFGLWLVFGGVSHFIARYVTKKIGVVEFGKRFIGWSFVYCALACLGILGLAALAESLSEQILPLIGSQELGIVAMVYLFVLGYLYFVSMMQPAGKILETLRRKEPLAVLAVHALLCGILLLNGMWLFNIEWWFLLAFVLLVILPYLALARTHLAQAVLFKK